MLRVEEMLLCEEIKIEMNGEEEREEGGLPPGFRFHPTDEELLTFYLASKLFNSSNSLHIPDVDLHTCEPWELPEGAKKGEREWYLFSWRDRKYPTGLRTNRATAAGYWKATGKDKQVNSASNGALLGLKKTLVFYHGRAPRGLKTKWVMHEYRLHPHFSCLHPCKEEWVICRIFHKSEEKKNSLVQIQEQGYLLEATSPPHPCSSLPPLLEAPTTTLEYQYSQRNSMESLHNPFLIRHEHQENDFKSLILNPLISQSHNSSSINNAFQVYPSLLSTPNTIIDYPLSSSMMLFKSLLSHQDCTLIEQSTVSPTQCKTEANFLPIQLPAADADFDWVDKIHFHPHPNTLFSFSDMDCNVLGISGSATAAAADYYCP